MRLTGVPILQGRQQILQGAGTFRSCKRKGKGQYEEEKNEKITDLKWKQFGNHVD